MQIKQLMNASLDHLKNELKNVRTSRANPSLLDSVMVEAYGSNMKLRDIANITTPEARQIVVTPFDTGNIHLIAKGIEKENLSVNPMIEGTVIRINVPPMDESMRKKMVKLAWEKCEQCKISIRETRRKINEETKDRKNKGEITEDDQKRLENETQEMTNKYCNLASELTKSKEEEILRI